MKRRALVVLIVLAAGAAAGCRKAPLNADYPGNRAPLLAGAYTPLPLGAVKPEGWLRDELVIQSKGLTGYVDEFYLKDSRWKGGRDNNIVPGTRDSWAVAYLNGLVSIAYLLDDTRLKAKAQEYIEWIFKSAQPDGWFGPPWEQGYEEATVCDPGHQMRALAALLQYAEATGDERVLPLAKGFMGFMMKNIREFPLNKWWGMGAMAVAPLAYVLYNATGERAYLDYVTLVHDHSYDFESFFLDFPWDKAALDRHKVPYNWTALGKTAHGPLLFRALSYASHWNLLSPNERSVESIYTGIESLEKYHGQAGGRFSGDEHISGTRPTQGTELCGIINTLATMENLAADLGDPAFGDRLELVAFNGLPGTITPDFWAHQYVQQANQVLVSNAEREWSTNPLCANIYGLSPHYPCCLFSMHRGFPGYVENMWMATPDGGLVAVAYGPSRVKAKAAGVDVVITEETEYPFDGAIRLIVEPDRAAEFPLHLRIPGWADGATVRAGSKTLRPKAGTVCRVLRDWKPGDIVQIDFPMKVRTETRTNGAITLLRGPLVYALRIGKDFRRVVTTDYYCVPNRFEFKGTADWEIHPTTAWNYGLIIDAANPDASITVRRNEVGRFPFADSGDIVYIDEENAFSKYAGEAPVVLTIKGRKIPGWGLKNNSADDPPQSPVLTGEPEEDLVLVPYGCARLRITEFPVVSRKRP